jgi:hypothetical protein
MDAESSLEDPTDLASIQPGQHIAEQALALREAAPFRTLLARMLHVHTDERAWRIGTKGERAVAEQLGRLAPPWRVLHSIVLSESGADLDHLAIGPGGVYAINSKNHPGKKVWVGGNTVMVNGRRQPYIGPSRSEARKVSRLLSAATGFQVPVTGVVAIVNAALRVSEQPADVCVVGRRDLVDWLQKRSISLNEEQIVQVYAAARQSTTWMPNRRPGSSSSI